MAFGMVHISTLGDDFYISSDGKNTPAADQTCMR